MSEELWRIFHADDVEESELAQVIARQLPAARQVAPDEVEYLHSHAEGDYSLKLVYEGSELIALEAGAALLQADIEAIEQGLDAILPTDEITVGVSILFHGDERLEWWLVSATIGHGENLEAVAIPPPSHTVGSFSALTSIAQVTTCIGSGMSNEATSTSLSESRALRASTGSSPNGVLSQRQDANRRFSIPQASAGSCLAGIAPKLGLRSGS